MTSSQVRPLPNERGWYIADPNYPFETFIGGDEAGPSSAFLQLVERAISQIDALVTRTKTYLDHYVDRQRFAGGTEWYFGGITAGRDPADAPTDLWFEFTTEGDIYGFWVVRLREYNGYFFLIEFRRI